MLFGIAGGPVAHPRPLGVAAVFGSCCLLLAVAGMVRVVWRWRAARRAEQLLLLVIVAQHRRLRDLHPAYPADAA